MSPNNLSDEKTWSLHEDGGKKAYNKKKYSHVFGVFRIIHISRGGPR